MRDLIPGPRLSCAEALRRALAGDRSAEERLARRLLDVPRLLSAMNARLGAPLSEHDLADLAQDAVIVVLRKLREHEPEGMIEGWIYRVCSLELMNAVRRKRRSAAPSVEDLGVERGAVDELRRLDFEDVASGLATLTPDEATAIRQKFFGGQTFDEVAAALGVSQGTIKAWYYRGLSKLHDFMRNRYPEEARAESSAR